MKSRLIFLVCLIGITVSAANAQEYQMPTEWRQVFVVLLSLGESSYDDAERETILRKHIQYQLGLQANGDASAAGGFMEREDGLLGMTLLNVDSKEAAQRLVNSDPAVQAGHLKATIKTWYIPEGL